MAHKSHPPSGAERTDRAHPTLQEIAPFLPPNPDEEEGPVEEPWTSKSLGASFIWIETGMSSSPLRD